MLGTQKLDAGYPESNEDGISRQLMERPPVYSLHIYYDIEQAVWMEFTTLDRPFTEGEFPIFA